MIKLISDYEYLGNGLVKINSNMNEFNVRVDLLYNNIENWESLNNFNFLKNKFDQLYTVLTSFSADWKSTADLVYNVKGYWEQPILIAFHRTFNFVANFVEIETWLNENFPTREFSPTQIIRCDFLCKNYNDESLDGFRLVNYDPIKAEEKASFYGTTSKKVYRFLGIKNQLNSIIFLINALLRKYNNTSYIINRIQDLSVYSSFIGYNKSLNTFFSEELKDFSPTDLAYFQTYITQYNNVYKIYQRDYIQLESIPADDLLIFDLRDVAITSGGSFFFKNIKDYWTYYPYTNIEFCPKNVCSDCYDEIDINNLYKNREYCNGIPKYILTECGETIPYTPPYTGPLNVNDAKILDLSDNSLDQLSMLLI
jgi:hypothetical protein